MRFNPDITRYYISFLLRMVQREESLASVDMTALFDRLEAQVLGMLQRRDNLTPDMVVQQGEHLKEARRLLSLSNNQGDLQRMVDAIERFGESQMVDHIMASGAPERTAPAVVAIEAGEHDHAPSHGERRWVFLLLLAMLVLSGLAGWLGGYLARPAAPDVTALCPSVNCAISDWIEVPQAGRNVVSFDHGLPGRPALVQVWFAQSRVGGTSTLLSADMTGNPRAIEVDERRVLVTILPDSAFRLYDPVKGTVEALPRGYIRVVAQR